MHNNLFDVKTCPKCGSFMYNGQCENKDCDYHWHPLDEEEDEENE